MWVRLRNVHDTTICPGCPDTGRVSAEIVRQLVKLGKPSVLSAAAAVWAKLGRHPAAARAVPTSVAGFMAAMSLNCGCLWMAAASPRSLRVMLPAAPSSSPAMRSKACTQKKMAAAGRHCRVRSPRTTSMPCQGSVLLADAACATTSLLVSAVLINMLVPCHGASSGRFPQESA